LSVVTFVCDQSIRLTVQILPIVMGERERERERENMAKATLISAFDR
jgi:hypothetical protein